MWLGWTSVLVGAAAHVASVGVLPQGEAPHAATLPPNGRMLPPWTQVTNASFWSLGGEGKFVTRAVVPDGTGEEALRLVTLPLWATCSKRDTGLLTFTARASPPSAGALGQRGRSLGPRTSSHNVTLIVPVIQSDLDKSYTKSVDLAVRLNSSYQNISIPFTFRQTDPSGLARIMFEIGFEQPQSIDLKRVQLEVWPASEHVDPASLPSCCGTPDYPGREANATWRVEALARIDTLRRAPLTVHVTDASGHPKVGCDINATMTRSDFRFGSAVNQHVWYGLHNGVNASIYRQEFLRLFNTAVFEGEMKWPEWEADAPSHNQTLELVDTLIAAGIRVRGHNLVWPSCGGSGKVPTDVCAGPIAANTSASRATLEAAIEAHIADEVTTLKARGCCEEFDVVNEPHGNPQIVDFLGVGNGSMLKWLAAANASNPSAGRRINEDRVCSAFFDIDSPQQAYYKEMLPWMAQTAPGLLTGLGCESHLDGTVLPAPTDMLGWYEWAGTLGLTVRVTEFDVVNADDALYADYLRDTLIALYSSPSADGFLMWGFTDDAHWLHSAPLFRSGWVGKPGLAVWEEWVLGKWRTDVSGITDSAGGWEAGPVHHGEYNVEVRCGGGAAVVREVHVTAGGAEITVQV